MGKKKKILIVTLALLISFSVQTTAMITYQEIYRYTNSFVVTENGIAACQSSLETFSSDRTVYVYAYIQRYENDNWITVKSGSTSDTDGNVSIYMEKMVGSGYEYRLKSNAYVYDSGFLLESDVYYSASQFY